MDTTYDILSLLGKIPMGKMAEACFKAFDRFGGYHLAGKYVKL
jgi:hypothetical protein